MFYYFTYFEALYRHLTYFYPKYSDIQYISTIVLPADDQTKVVVMKNGYCKKLRREYAVLIMFVLI